MHVEHRQLDVRHRRGDWFSRRRFGEIEQRNVGGGVGLDRQFEINRRVDERQIAGEREIATGLARRLLDFLDAREVERRELAGGHWRRFVNFVGNQRRRFESKQRGRDARRRAGVERRGLDAFERHRLDRLNRGGLDAFERWHSDERFSGRRLWFDRRRRRGRLGRRRRLLDERRDRRHPRLARRRGGVEVDEDQVVGRGRLGFD
ncbi:MAG: hypothetical protein HYV19_02865 [Gemmatimonadetes bacterium]|nr:hypothetical protein [Gemmatimonadota bacterium]